MDNKNRSMPCIPEMRCAYFPTNHKPLKFTKHCGPFILRDYCLSPLPYNHFDTENISNMDKFSTRSKHTVEYLTVAVKEKAEKEVKTEEKNSRTMGLERKNNL